jgi:hypothetical protein
MPTSAFSKCNSFVQDLGSKAIRLSSDSLKVALTNTAPTAATTTYTALPGEVANGGGYTTGGAALTGVTWTNSSGTSSLKASNLVFTATTGFGPFRYALMYSDTSTGKSAIGWYDYGVGGVTLAASETFTLDVTTNVSILTVA